MSSRYIKRTKIATAIPKRSQKAESKAQAGYKAPESFTKPRYTGGRHVPNSVNIMPIVNVNVNLNLSSQSKNPN